MRARMEKIQAFCPCILLFTTKILPVHSSWLVWAFARVGLGLSEVRFIANESPNALKSISQACT